jgi:phosphoribosylformylglycinamidine cyclo-ligase
MKSKKPPLTYAAAGVDIDARRAFVQRIRPMAERTYRPEVLAGVGPFGAMFRLAGYREPVLVSSTDSVGTKVKIASLLGRYDTVGIDLVNQNVNDIITCGAQPLFFLDYIASSSLSADEKAALVEGAASACSKAGCSLIGGETADMPDIYAPGDFDIVGFVVGAVEHDEIIDGSSIRAGDALIGLPSNGLHTNGFSLVRHVLGVGLGANVGEDRARLDREEPELERTLGEELLRTHRSYVAEVQKVRSQIKGVAHITGGGLIENVPRMLPPTGSGQGSSLGARIDRSAWDVPPIFGLLQREGRLADDEMWRTFNMGIGLVLAVDPSDAAAVRAALPDAIPVGEVVKHKTDDSRVKLS